MACVWASELKSYNTRESKVSQEYPSPAHRNPNEASLISQRPMPHQSRSLPAHSPLGTHICAHIHADTHTHTGTDFQGSVTPGTCSPLVTSIPDQPPWSWWLFQPGPAEALADDLSPNAERNSLWRKDFMLPKSPLMQNPESRH